MQETREQVAEAIKRAQAKRRPTAADFEELIAEVREVRLEVRAMRLSLTAA
jgi:hypothetical protein